ncbi:MAG: nicotinamide-nucleotide amidohydrolase family protein [Lactobacillaceae bacterium]|nr:nicotinamide-nucleotide amidohydrolase family protein [Lactobacillaceae bacterium]
MTIQELGESLIERRQTITSAESLTAGLFAASLAEVSGISAVFPGAFVTYAAEAKTELVGVPKQLIETYGVVSKQVALAMAFGALRRLKTDWAVSFTGVAGPDSLEGQPAGTVYIGIAHGIEGSYAQKFSFSGDRQAVRKQSVEAAAELLGAILKTPEKYFEQN